MLPAKNHANSAVDDGGDADEAADAGLVREPDGGDERRHERGEAEQHHERPQLVRADLLLERHGPNVTATGSRSASSSIR